MVTKVFYDQNDNQLTTYVNDKNLCFIRVGQNILSEEIEYNGSIVLDSEDLLELISELKSIKRQMDNNE